MRRLGVVVALALAGFVVALNAFGDAAWDACVGDAPDRAGYAAELEGPVEVGDEVHVLILRHQGQPVSDARVCVSARPPDGSGAPVGAQAHEVAPGRFEVRIAFGTAGRWEGTVLLAEEGETTPQAAVPISFEVTR